MIYEMTLSELQAAYITLEKRYASAGSALDAMQEKITDLQNQVILLQAQKMQWDSDKDAQNGVIQATVGDLNKVNQEQAEEISKLRDRLRVREEPHANHN